MAESKSRGVARKLVFAFLCVALLVALWAWWFVRAGNDAVAKARSAARQTTGTSEGRSGTRPQSSAPWEAAYVRLRNERYATLIPLAPTAPHAGSYGIAIKALEECARYPDPDAGDPGIRFADPLPGKPTPRRDAYEALRRPCKGLGTQRGLKEQIERLRKDGIAAGDSLLKFEQRAEELLDPTTPHEVRELS